MAPKKAVQTKRAADEAAPRGRPAKKAKADPLHQGIAEAVGLAEETLSAECRAMLTSMIPGAFGDCQEDRDPYQARAVAMIGEVVEGVRARMRRELEVEVAKAAEIEASKDGLEGKAKDVGTVLAAAASALEAKSTALATVSAEVLERKTALSAVVEAKKGGDASSDAIAKSKEQYESVIAEELKLVQDGESQTKKESDKLISFVKKLPGMDESLLKAAPSTCAKKADARSTFDNMVLESLAKCLQDHVAHQTSELEAAKPGNDERAAALRAAETALEEAKARQNAIATETSTAQAAHTDAQAGSKAAEAAVKNFGPMLADAREKVNGRREVLSNFEAWNVSCFEMSRDKKRKPDSSAAEPPDVDATADATPIVSAPYATPAVLAQSSAVE